MSPVIPDQDVVFAGQIDIWRGKKQEYPEQTQIEIDYIQWLQRGGGGVINDLCTSLTPQVVMHWDFST